MIEGNCSSFFVVLPLHHFFENISTQKAENHVKLHSALFLSGQFGSFQISGSNMSQIS